ncbi:MAG: YebC/PmpR family DNA-binding regulatory protein [Phycisphaerales bacterium]|jgi:YebC/PmpR family DNA-binding regulatory protein
MAGHSKWANIRHRKDRQDKKKGKVWSKCSKAIMAAARTGGMDPDTNLGLRYAIDEAKYANMPKDTIKRAIEKGAGSAGGEDFAPITYEGYGPGGVAVIVDALTDNKNRSVTDVRNAFKKTGGSMGNTGSVAFMFQTKGQIVIEGDKADEDTVMEAAINAGAEDVEAPEGDGGAWTVLTDPTRFITVREAIEAAGIEIAEAQITKISEQRVEMDADKAQKLMNLLDALEDSDDVQKVFTNADISDEIMAGLE